MGFDIQNFSARHVLIFLLLVVLIYLGLKKIKLEQNYSNTKSGYSLTYKSSWELSSLPESTANQKHAQIIYLQKANKDPKKANTNRSVAMITITKLDNPQNLNLRALYAKTNFESDQNLAKVGAPEKKIIEIQYLGKNSLKVTTPGINNLEFFVDKGNGVFLSIAMEFLGDENDITLLPEAQGIIDSIKFK